MRDEAYELAVKLNGNSCGIIAPDGAGTWLDQQTEAAEGEHPIWGQKGEFEAQIGSVRFRAAIDGIFQINIRSELFGHHFGVRAVDKSQPFISDTGFRSFMGCHMEPEPGFTPDMFVCRIVNAYIQQDLKGKLTQVSEQFGGPAPAGTLL